MKGLGDYFLRIKFIGNKILVGFGQLGVGF